MTVTNQTEPDPASTASAETKTSPSAFSSTDVHLGHLFDLRPRVDTSFRQQSFLDAKRSLRDERYESLAEAARAVAEEALALTRGKSSRSDSQRRR